MKKILFYLLLLVNSLWFLQPLSAQKKVVIMGSSTAAGQGASSPATSWVGRLQTHFRQNTSDGLDTTVTSIAFSGQTTYHQMPTGFVSPIPGRPAPDPNSNVTRALSFSPDVIIINLPTNDIANGYTKKECMDNFRLMYQAITAANVRCYITTSQPRSLTTALRDSLRTLADSVRNNFALRSIDFWTDLVTTDGLNNIKPEVSVGDGIHINDLGHNYVFIRTRDRNIFALNIPLPLRLLDFKSQLVNNTVLLTWRSELEEPGTTYELQKKAGNGTDFQPVYTRAANGTGQATNYNWTDQNPQPGQNQYRLKMTEPNKESYSSTVSVLYKPKNFDIRRLYIDNSLLNLVVQINSQKEQQVLVEVINTAGVVLLQRKQALNHSLNQFSLPVAQLAAGQYFFRVRDAENNYSVQAFFK
ncbi:MAG: T9SS type A sorting domain-containing protein [Chitinophagales bacterium]|nr:T9SS type A sorting domain-containing protein [Chitinophagales bacterium]